MQKKLSAQMTVLVKKTVIEYLISFSAFFAITALAYRRIFDGWFVADDFLWLDLSNINNVLDSFIGPWGHGRAYRPLTRVSYLLDFFSYGKHFPGWILTNMLLHALMSTALYRLSFMLKPERVTAAIIALLFCLSPIAAENVAWISGRTHILSAMFITVSMIPLWSFLHERGHWESLILSVSFFAAGLLCYEAASSGIAFCALAVAFVVWQRGSIDMRSFVVMVLWVTIFLVYLAIRESALSSMSHPFSTQRELSWTGIVRDVRLSANILFVWSQLTLPLLILGGAAFLLKPIVTATTAILCATLILVSLLPFLVLEDLGTRFFYSAQIFVSLFAAVAVRTLMQDRRIWVGWIGVTSLCFIIFNSVDRIGLVTRDWRDSGAIGRSLAIQVKSLLPRPPDGTAILVHGAPVSYGSAPMFIGYLDKVIRWYYEKFDGIILNSWEFGDVNYLPYSIRGQVAYSSATCPEVKIVAQNDFMNTYGTLQSLHDLIFRCQVQFMAFDRKTLAIREVTREEWFALFESEPGMLKIP